MKVSFISLFYIDMIEEVQKKYTSSINRNTLRLQTPKATKILEISGIKHSSSSVLNQNLSLSKIKSAHISPKYNENITVEHPKYVYNSSNVQMSERVIPGSNRIQNHDDSYINHVKDTSY